MPSFRTGTVTRLLSDRTGIQRVEVDGEPAYVLTELIGPVAHGDEVVINTTAVDLGLGTGGWHVVHWNLSRREWAGPQPGHIMKLRYTSLQTPVGSAEEHDPSLAEGSLEKTPVIVCGLHSQISPVAAAIAHRANGTRVVFVMTDSASLPLALSDSIAALVDHGYLHATVTTGQAFGGTDEGVTVHSGLLVAARKHHADVIVLGPGPGVVGTGSRYGFGSLEVGPLVDAVGDLGGQPVVALRWSDADLRERHRGLSHHAKTSLTDVCHTTAILPFPSGLDAIEPLGAHVLVEVDVPELSSILGSVGDLATTMGRSWQEDTTFFRFAVAAGLVAAELR